MHSGIGGLAYTLAEIRLTRPWTTAEEDLATGIADRIRALIPNDRSTTFFDGEVSSIGILSALEEPGTDVALQRIRDLATDDGWPESFLDEPRYEPGAFANDVTLGTAAVLLGAVWAMRRGEDASALASHAADVVLGEKEETPAGVNWQFVSRRFRTDEPSEMPNFTHGLAGIATALAVAGETPSTWHRRCLDSVRYSGIPERLHPGFWDNDGRCCGTAGVGDAFLDSGHDQDLEFAVLMGDTLLDHAHHEGSHAYWRFIEHRNEDPLLPPGVGWMQGAAGIAAYLFRVSRVVGNGLDAPRVTRPDAMWG